MRRQIEEWHPTGIQVAGEKKIKIESRRRQQKHGVLLRCVYLYLCTGGNNSHIQTGSWNEVPGTSGSRSVVTCLCYLH